MTSLLQDLRFAFRQLRRAPLFALSVLLTLTLAVGATAAMVSVLRATLLTPLPFSRPSQLVQIGDRSLKGLPFTGLISVPRVADLAQVQTSGGPLFSKLGFYYIDATSLTVDGHAPIRVAGVAASGDFFPTLGAQPLLGRTFTPADDAAKGPQLLVLSYNLWATAFGSDPSVIGRMVRLGSEAGMVLGVMPQRFDLPAGTGLWHTAHINPSTFSGGYRGDGMRWLLAVARLSEGQTVASADAATAALASHLAESYPNSDAVWGFQLTSLRDTLFGEYKHALWLLAAAVGLVLLVSTMNIAGLQLSRNAARGAEFALREALGVTRARLVRQLLTECFLLTALGGVAGLAVAVGLLHALTSQLPTALLCVEPPRLDLAVLGMSLLIALVVGLLTSLVPVVQSTRPRSLATLGGSGLGAVHAGRTRTFGRTFLTLQIAISLILLTLSASVLGSLYRLLATPMGFDQSRVQTFSVDLPWDTEGAKSTRVQAAAEAAFGAIPGVSAAGGIAALPLSTFSLRANFDIAGEPSTPRHDAVVAEARSMTPGYLAAMRIPLLAGRSLTARDAGPNAPSVLLINRTLANRFFAGRNPIGQQLMYGVGVNGVGSSEIVGVTGDVLGTGGSLNRPPQPEVYTPAIGTPHMQFALRTDLPAGMLEPTLRRVIGSLDADASLGDIEPLEASLDRVLRQPKLNAALLSGFAGLSLLLVVIGVYGLAAFEVAQRTRELGLRMALGATRAGVMTMMVKESARVLTAGLALGAAGGWAAEKTLAANGLAMTASATGLLSMTAGLLALAVVGATLAPARRAATIDPMQALRSE